MFVKYFKLILFFVFLYFFNVSNTYASNGAPGSTGEVVFVEGNNGIVGWAKGPNGEKIKIDFYLTRRGGVLTNFVCSGGEILANQTVQSSFEGYEKVKSNNAYIFTFTNSCLKDISDGDYDLYLALGPNLFAPKLFQFSVITDSISSTRYWAHYLGVVIDRVPGNYDSYPTIMKDGDIYKMWYASGNTSGHDGDNIFYAESNNGVNWNSVAGQLEGGGVLTPTFNSCTCSIYGNDAPSCPQGQDFSIDDMHVADPSVVKVNGVYYMYYTAASKKFSCYGSNNHIGLATSSDGVNWQKSSTPVSSPVNPCLNYTTCGPWVSGYASWYGAGMPSVIYFDYNDDGVKEFVNFYADTSVMAYSMTLATTKDLSGKDFKIVQEDIVGDNSYDYKFSKYLDRYIAVNALPTSPNNPGLIVIGFANKSNIVGSQKDYNLRWNFINKKTLPPNFQGDITPRQTAFTMDQFTNDQNHWVINNAGFIGSTEGIINDRNTVMYMGAGLGMQPHAATWDIIGIDLWMSHSYDFNLDNVINISDANYLINIFFSNSITNRRYTLVDLISLIKMWKY